MRTTLAKSGRGDAVRLPREILERAGVKPGDAVDVTIERGRVVLTPVVARDPSIDELAARMKALGGRAYDPGRESTPDGLDEWPREEDVAEIVRTGLHPMVDWGPDRGSEVIDDAYSRGKIVFDEVSGEFVTRSRTG